MSESAQQTAAEIPIDWIRWIPAGQVTVDGPNRLVFPSVPPIPGIYRFTIKDGGDAVAGYIGQTKTSLVARFRRYRRRGKNPLLPLEKNTTSRNARYFLEALATGRSVSVALLDDHATAPDGRVIMINLADNAIRDGLERKLIACLCSTGIEVLNRNHNPKWGAREVQ